MAAQASRGQVESYWYADSDGSSSSRAVLVLRALRHFHATDFAMRQRLKTEMHMNETDLRALRHLIAAESEGNPIGPTDLTRQLGISSAATAKLLARMVGSGHIRRELNPLDRRAQLLHATAAAHREVRQTLESMHGRMLAVATSLTADEQNIVINFLDALSAVVAEPIEPNGEKSDGKQPLAP